jgi:hypothetical protein
MEEGPTEGLLVLLPAWGVVGVPNLRAPIELVTPVPTPIAPQSTVSPSPQSVPRAGPIHCACPTRKGSCRIPSDSPLPRRGTPPRGHSPCPRPSPPCPRTTPTPLQSCGAWPRVHCILSRGTLVLRAPSPISTPGPPTPWSGSIRRPTDHNRHRWLETMHERSPLMQLSWGLPFCFPFLSGRKPRADRNGAGRRGAGLFSRGNSSSSPVSGAE